jgi:hypothetical protein
MVPQADSGGERMRKRKKEKRMIRTTALTLALMTAISSVTAVSAFADGENYTGRGGTGYNAEKWEALHDNIMEYDELPDLVHEFNSTIGDIWDTLEDTQEDLKNYADDLESARLKVKNLEDDAKDDAKDALKSGDMASYVSSYTDYMTHHYQVNGYGALPSFSSLIGSFREQADSLLMTKSTVNSIKKGEHQIVQAAQQLMITYQSLQKQKRTLEAMSAMYQEQYKIYQDMQAQGLATDQDVLTARANALYADSLIASVNSGLLQLKPVLCTLTGWPADADPVIGEIPPVDASEIDQMNLEEDTRKAIGNNTTLISQRTSAKGKTMDGVQARLAMIDEGDQKLTIKMKALYDDVISKKTAYEAAQDGYQAAIRDREKYHRMYDIGYLSYAEFIGTETAYYQSEASYYAADTSFRLAMETYNWAVEGLTEIE